MRIFIKKNPDEQSRLLEIPNPEGLTLMDVLKENDEDIPAICGGMGMCATCLVRVDPKWTDRLPTPNMQEEEKLSYIHGVDAQTRMSCQIMLNESLDQLAVEIAKDLLEP